jgi:hypothetical protein
MTLSFADRLGLAALIVTLLSIAAVYLLPEKKWIGWLGLIAAVILILAWLRFEFQAALFNFAENFPVRSSLAVGLCFGALAGFAWLHWMTKISAKDTKVGPPTELPQEQPPIKLTPDVPKNGNSNSGKSTPREESSPPTTVVNQGPGSIAQVGGSHNKAVVTNNFGPQLRLPDQQIGELAQLLAQQHGTVDISTENADGTTLEDANNLLAAFAKAGWNRAGVNVAIHGADIGADGLPIPTRKGIHIYARPEKSSIAFFIGGAIKHVTGIQPRVETDEVPAQFDVEIFVGASE